ncbi:hypothetical protein ACJRW5_22450 [Pseudomonas sp. SH1-B]
METIHLPTVHWPLFAAYTLLVYAALLVRKQSNSMFGVIAVVSFALLAIIEVTPMLLFHFINDLESVLAVLSWLRSWPHALLLVCGPLSVILALRTKQARRYT